MSEPRYVSLSGLEAVIDDWATVGSSNIDPFSLPLAVTGLAGRC